MNYSGIINRFITMLSVIIGLTLVQQKNPASGTIFAENPIITQRYTADPNGFVYNDRLYVICSSDEDQTSSYDLMNYTLVSTDDMVNWTDHNLVFKVKSVTIWATQAYAPTAIVRNGKVYLYFPNSGTSIGVAVADRPEGPYKDPLGKALITKSMANCNVDWLFDPCIFVDSTTTGKQAYLTFGGGQNSTSPYGKNLRIIKLNDDMISVSGTAVTVEAPNSFEASYLYKNNNKYYFCWATTGASKIDYSMSDDPMTGYIYKGTILDNPTLNGVNIDGNNNSHGGPILFKDQWYMLYHDRRLSNNSTYKRNASCDALSYNTDGTVKKVIVTSEGPAQIKMLDPYDTIQAETIWKQNGIKTDFCDEGGVMLTNISEGDYTSLKGVDFGDGAKTFEVRAASATSGGTVEVHLENETGTLTASCNVDGTGSWTSWKTFSCKVTDCSGVKNVYFVYKGASEPFRLNWFRFTPATVGTLNNENKFRMVQKTRTLFTTSFSGADTFTGGTVFDLSGKLLYNPLHYSSMVKVPANGMFVIKNRQ